MKMNNEEKKKLIIRYVVAVILLVVTILVLKGMYQDAEEHDNAPVSYTHLTLPTT